MPYQKLSLAAGERHISMAELVRRLIDQGLARLGAPSELGEGVIRVNIDEEMAALREEVRALRRQVEGQTYP